MNIVGARGRCFDHLRVLAGSSACRDCLGGEPDHFKVTLLHLDGLVVANDDSVVRIAPSNRCLIDLELAATQVRQIYPLIVLLIDCLEHDLLLLVVNLDNVVILWVG